MVPPVRHQEGSTEEGGQYTEGSQPRGISPGIALFRRSKMETLKNIPNLRLRQGDPTVSRHVLPNPDERMEEIGVLRLVTLGPLYLLPKKIQ
ncbi:hypothetical protein NDU88_007128 [Pleurodeles waltl]|uniref:Uncharacterized protein n=1 Tax=Pleurodeles waltl TaxID=8319 RepID=A0AAV7QL50_PLEWA|nr:hypothetical protein NDU88_007128 [Pleurodeles waltl]